MKHLIKRTILIVNILAALLLLASYFSPQVSPEKFWIFAFIGLFYPFFLILNVLFILFWIVFRKFYFLISLTCILAGLPFLKRIIQIQNPFRDKYYYQQKYQPGNTSFKLLTFNVRLFNLYKWESKTDAEAGIFDYINREDPDIICFQEFYTRDDSHLSEENIRNSLKKCKYAHITYTSNNKANTSHFGIATFSSYPIVGKGEIKFPNTFNVCIYTDLKIGNDTVRIYNNHLQSIKFLKEDYVLIDTIRLQYNERQVLGLQKILVRVRDAFRTRAQQVDDVSAQIRRSPHPVIVCGDFNDSPVSYSYKTMRNKLKDAFIESGNGIGYTYRGKFPSYRIDYILYDPLFRSYEYESPKLELSDHYPVICRFILP
jgi:endonuclease/exonuclease/phosphatase family metal-dependent hydrolase